MLGEKELLPQRTYFKRVKIDLKKTGYSRVCFKGTAEQGEVMAIHVKGSE